MLVARLVRSRGTREAMVSLGTVIALGRHWGVLPCRAGLHFVAWRVVPRFPKRLLLTPGARAGLWRPGDSQSLRSCHPRCRFSLRVRLPCQRGLLAGCGLAFRRQQLPKTLHCLLRILRRCLGGTRAAFQVLPMGFGRLQLRGTSSFILWLGGASLTLRRHFSVYRLLHDAHCSRTWRPTADRLTVRTKGTAFPFL